MSAGILKFSVGPVWVGLLVLVASLSEKGQWLMLITALLLVVV